MQPNNLFTSLSSSNILDLCCWKCNNLLKFRNPTYCCSTYNKNIPYDVPPILFINMSAGFWLVCIFSNFNSSSSGTNIMKWYLSYICLVFEWKVEFFARWMALWLSLYNLLLFYFLPNSSMNLCNQIISLLASVTATYSASVIESATTCCSF